MPCTHRALALKYSEKRPPALDAGQRKIIAQRYANGETIAALALDYDCGDATIWRVLHGV
jgi:hypothetical protein